MPRSRGLGESPLSCRILLGVDSFCLHSLRQLVWWQPDRLLGVAAGQEEAIVELSISTKGSLEIAKW